MSKGGTTYAESKLLVPVEVILRDVLVLLGLADLAATLLGPPLLEILELGLHRCLLKLFALTLLLLGEMAVHLHLLLLIRGLDVGVSLRPAGCLLGASHCEVERN